MSYIDAVNRAIKYIESQLKEPIQVEDIAGAAYYSKYHFQRLFSLMLGETVGNYLRKRRLSEAARELVETDRHIIDIAIDYQFQSQEAFGRSFKNLFGITPYQYRKDGHIYTYGTAEPLTPTAVSFLNERISKEPEIITRDKITLIGLPYYGQNKQEIQDLWHNFNQRAENIKKLIKPYSCYGLVCYDERFFTSRDFWYMAGAEVNKSALNEIENLPFEYTLKVIPAATYAVFTQKGVFNQIPVAYEYIYGTWFSQSEYEPIAPFDFEFYDQEYDAEQADQFEFKICIPIKLLT